jgi:hypothetical protein
MKHIYAITRTSSNSIGREEIKFEYKKTFFQRLFKRSNTVEIYVFYPSCIEHLGKYRHLGSWLNVMSGKSFTKRDPKHAELEAIRYQLMK